MALTAAKLTRCLASKLSVSSPVNDKKGGFIPVPPPISRPSSGAKGTARVVSGKAECRAVRPRRRDARVTAAVSVTTPDVVVTDKNELFKEAAKSGDLLTIRQLIGEVDVNSPSPERGGWTALHLSAFYEHPEITEFLLDSGADTEVRNASGNTPLQFACLKGNLQIAKLLIDRGADVHATSNDKGSVLDYAEEWGGEEMVNFLTLEAIRQHVEGTGGVGGTTG